MNLRKKKWIILGFFISSIFFLSLIKSIILEQHHVIIIFENTGALDIKAFCDNQNCLTDNESVVNKNDNKKLISILFEKHLNHIILRIKGVSTIIIKNIDLDYDKSNDSSVNDFVKKLEPNESLRWLIIKNNALILKSTAECPIILNRFGEFYSKMEFDVIYPQICVDSLKTFKFISSVFFINIFFASFVSFYEKIIEAKKSILEIIYFIGFYLVIMITIIILFTSIMFIIGINISIIHFPVEIFISLLFFLAVMQNNRKRILLYASIIFSFLIAAGCIFISSCIYDISWDGNSYHKLAIGSLKNGWNPVYESSREYNLSNKILPDFLKDRHVVWVDHYPKVSWIFASVLYKITNNIETGKSLNLIMMVAVFCLFFYYLNQKKISIYQSAIVSVITVITPVTIVQAFNNYIDGLLAILLYLLILSLVTIFDNNVNIFDKEKWTTLFCSIILCSNIKFTGLVFASVFCFAFYIFWILIHIRLNQFKILFTYITLFFIATFIFSIAIIGSSSYLKNFRDHGHILYPIMGNQKIDIMTFQQPISFSEKSGIERLFVSLFSKVQISSLDEPILKFPFTVSALELSNLISADARICGYGVWFSGIFIISIVITALGLYYLFRMDRYWFYIILLILGNSIFILILIKESWLARYAPTLYIFPIIALIFCFMKKNKNVISKFAMLILLFAISANITFFVLFNMLRVFTKNIITTMELDILKKEATNRTAILYFQESDFAGVLYNFNDLGIKYAVSQHDIANGKTIYMEIKYIVSY